MKSPANELYLGKVVRTTADMASRLYWDTAARVEEVMKAVGIDVSNNVFCRQIGPAIIAGVECSKCGVPCEFRNRTEANSFLLKQQNIARHPYGHSREFVCGICRAKAEALRDEKDRADAEARKIREHALRFMPYAEYLRTPEWQEKRQSALKRAGFRCQTCSAGGQLHVHHRTYINRGNEHSSDLIALCASCHSLFHANGKLAENGRAARGEAA